MDKSYAGVSRLRQDIYPGEHFLEQQVKLDDCISVFLLFLGVLSRRVHRQLPVAFTPYEASSCNLRIALDTHMTDTSFHCFLRR